MKKLLLLFAAALTAVSVNAQTVVFEFDGLESTSATVGSLSMGSGQTKVALTTSPQKYDANSKTPAAAITFEGGWGDGTNQYALIAPASGSFLEGDVITFRGYTNNSTTTKTAALIISKGAGEALWTSADFVDGRTVAGVPAEQSYTLEEDCSVLYLSRGNGSGSATRGNILSIVVTRPGEADPDAPTLESIAISGELTAETFYEGAAMDYAGLSVVGTYSNDSTATLTSGITWSIDPALAEGTTNYTITAAVGELTATKNVTLTVSAVVLSQIKIEGALLTPAYYTGSTLSLSGLVVNAYYSDNTKVDVTSQAGLTADVTTLTETVEVNFSAAFEDKTATKKVSVYVCAQPSSDMDTLLSYAHSSSANEGIAISGTTVFAKVKIHGNNDEVDCIQFKNGYTADGVYNNNSIVLSVTGGFKAGDEIIISGFFNNTDNTKDAKVTIFTLNEDNTPHVLQTMGQTINGRNAGDPFKCVYTLEADADVLYLGRTGNTGTNVYTITVQRPKPAEEPVYDLAAVISGGSLETPINVELTEGGIGLVGSYSGYFRVGTYSIEFVENTTSAPARAAADAQTFSLDDNGMYDLAIEYDGEVFTVTPTFNGYATAIENTEATQVEKKMINGQLVIIKNGVEYSVLGARL